MHASRKWAAASLTAAALALGTPASTYAADVVPAPAQPGHVVTVRHEPDGFPGPGGGDGPDSFRRHRHHHRRHHRCERRVHFTFGGRRFEAKLTFKSWGPKAVIKELRDSRDGVGLNGRVDGFRHHRHRLVLDARHPEGRIDGIKARIRDFYGHRPELVVKEKRRFDHRDGAGRGGRVDGRRHHRRTRHFRFPHYCGHRFHGRHHEHHHYPRGGVEAGNGGGVSGVNTVEMIAGCTLMAAAAGSLLWARRRRSQP